MVFLTADLHLNHVNIIKEDFGPHKRSQFSSVSEMNDLIIRNWKLKVSSEDTVYILGDIALGNPEEAASIIADLPGKKILLMGNHDVPKVKVKKKSKAAPQDLEHLKYPISLFEKVYPASERVALPFGKYTLEMNHYPPYSYMPGMVTMHHIVLHAHSHSRKTYNMANMALHIPVYDVGVDANDYSPISLDELHTTMLRWTKIDNVSCDVCGAPMRFVSGRYGAFLGCTRYPSCTEIYNSIKVEE